MHRIPRFIPSPAVLAWLGLFLVVLGAKWALIHAYASSLPYWDQWDAEADRLYLPYAEGTLTVGDVFSPHNEHRIVFTKLLSLGLLVLNQQWDARLQMTVNAPLHAAALAFFAWALGGTLRERGKVFAAMIGAAIFSLPIACENTLAGFQSQFYFVILFAALHLAGTFLPPPGSPVRWLAQAAGLAGVFSMASGAASAMTVVGLIVLRVIRRRAWGRNDLALLVINLTFVALTFWLRTDVPGHDELRAHSFTGLLAGLVRMAAWPALWWWAAPLAVAPHVVNVVRAWRDPEHRPLALLAACSIWWAGQVLLLGYGRGGSDAATSSRYYDLFGLGVWFGAIGWIAVLTTWPAGRARFAALVGAVGFTGVAIAGFVRETNVFYRTVQPSFAIVNPAREEAVRDYVANRSAAFFELSPWDQLPYPEAAKLASWLDLPALRRWLPAEVRLPVWTGLDGLDPATAETSLAPIPGPEAWRIEPAIKDSAPTAVGPEITTSFRYVRITRAAAPGSTPGEIRLVGTGGQITHVPPPGADGRWHSAIVNVPADTFRMELAPGTAWQAFTAPVEIGTASVIAGQLLKFAPALAFVGSLTLLSGLFFARRGRPATVEKSPCDPGPGVG